MLRSPLTLLAAATLVAGLAAQTPDGYLLVGARGTEIQMIDPATGVATPVYSRTTGTLTDVLGVCPDTTSANTLYAFGGAGFFLGPDVFPLVFNEENNVHAAPMSFIPAGFPGFSFPQRCVRVGSNLLATAISGGSNNGLWIIDLTAQTVSGVIVIPVNTMNTNGFASHVAAIGSNAYMATEMSSTGASAIYEWNTLLGTSRVVASNLTQNLRSMAAVAGTLLVGDDAGTVYSVDLVTGALTPTISTGLGLPIVAIASKGGSGDPTYLGVQDTDGMGNRVDRIYDAANLSSAIWSYTASASGGIQQVWVGTDPNAIQLAFGEGCATSVMTTPRHAYLGSPSLGNSSFAIGLADALPGAPSALQIGISRTVWSGGALPFDLSVIGMTGCSLYTEPVLSFGALTDAAGAASVPVPVPGTPATLGAYIISQWAILDTPANPFGIVSSDGEQNIVK